MSKYAFDPAHLKTMYEKPWKLRADAFRVFGGLYFVGNQDGASWLLKTDAGPVLFDTNYPTASAMLVDSIHSVGVDPRELVAIFHTHGHFDHFGSTEYLAELSGAKTYLGAADAEMFRERPALAMTADAHESHLELFVPDVEVQDGESFSFGSTVISAIATPGHCPGATSYFFDVTEGERTCRVGLHGGAGLNTLCRSFREQWGLDWRPDFLASIRKVIDEPVDIFLGNHTGQNRALQKAAALSGGDNPFIDPSEWRKFLTELEHKVAVMNEEEG